MLSHWSRNVLRAAALAAVAAVGPTTRATILVNYDASTGQVPDEVDPAWGRSGLPMFNNGAFLIQDTTFNSDNDYGEYYSPVLPAVQFVRGGPAYGIEFKVRPLGDLPFLGYAWPELYLSWTDDQNHYNISIDQFHETQTSGSGDVVYGRGSFYPAIVDIDWSQPHTIFIGYRDGAVFDFYLDGALKSTVVEGSIARDRAGWESFTNRVTFGDGTTGGPASYDVAAEWYFIRIHDVASPVVPPSAWAVNSNGNWSEAANWTNGVPNSLTGTATALFGSAIDAPKTVTLDVPQTIGYVIFDNANSYTVDGAATLSFSTPGTGQINVLQGNHTISAPVSMTSPVSATVAAGSTLTLSGASVTTGPGATLNKAGDGTLELSHIRGHRLYVDGGIARIIAGAAANSDAGASSLKDLGITGGPAAPTAKLDLTNNSMVLDYSGVSPADDVRQYLLNGGIISSSADANKKLGYGEASATGFANATFAGQAVDGDAVLIKFTYGGDSNLDGKVDVGDLGNLASNWQQSALWTGGDFDYNGTVNVGDLGILATNWQQGVTTPTLGPSFSDALAALGLGGVSVPEPGVIGLLAAAGMTLARPRRQS